MLPEEFAFFLFYILPENTGSATKKSRGAGRSSNRKSSQIGYMNSEELTVDSGQWTVDSGQWTVDSQAGRPSLKKIQVAGWRSNRRTSQIGYMNRGQLTEQLNSWQYNSTVLPE